MDLDPESSLDFFSDLTEHIFPGGVEQRHRDVQGHPDFILPSDMWFEISQHLDEKSLRVFGCVSIRTFILCTPMIYRPLKVGHTETLPVLPPWLGYKISNIKECWGVYISTEKSRHYFLADSSTARNCLKYTPTFAKVFKNATIRRECHEGVEIITVVTPKIWKGLYVSSFWPPLKASSLVTVLGTRR